MKRLLALGAAASSLLALAGAALSAQQPQRQLTPEQQALQEATKKGYKVHSAKEWWIRSFEIFEDFDREVYGRAPKKTPKVTWKATTTKETKFDILVITKQLIGRVDNSAYPQITVNIQLTLVTPAGAKAGAPVIMQFGFGGPRPGAQPVANRPADAPGGGAKLHRRNFGELVENLAGSGGYHWMAGNFIKYAGPLTANDLPVDAHLLIALCAPRPIFISYGATEGPGAEGKWVDQRGSFTSAVAAGPVYKLFGKKDLGTTEFPPLETALIDGELAWRQHSGGHTTGPNWPTFLTFAGRYIKGPALSRPPAESRQPNQYRER